MTLTCPCCRAANEDTACRRCKADLGLMFRLETRRIYHMTSARRFAADGRFGEALVHVDRASRLRPAVDSSRLRAALLLLCGDHAAALAAYHEAV